MSVASIGTASDINRLLNYLLPCTDGFERNVSEEEAMACAARLADAAHKKLAAGVDGADVRKAWRKHKPAPTKAP